MGMRVRVTVTVAVVPSLLEDEYEKTVAVTGGGVTVEIVGHTVTEIVELTHVLQGGQLTREQGMVKGRTTMTVDPPVTAGTVTLEHPWMQDLKARREEGMLTISGAMLGRPLRSRKEVWRVAVK